MKRIDYICVILFLLNVLAWSSSLSNQLKTEPDTRLMSKKGPPLN